MSFEHMRATAAGAAGKGADLGFDGLSVAAVETRLFGVRVANGAVCRENVDRIERALSVHGSRDGREGGFTTVVDAEAIDGDLGALRDALAQQPPNLEHVEAAVPGGSYSYDLTAQAFDECYAPDQLYGAIAELSRRARERGLRLTGYVEAQATRRHRFFRGGDTRFDLATHDHGLVASLTVDDPATGAVSSGSRGVARATAPRVAEALTAAYAEAERQCLAARRPSEPTPGDYTVVLHPQAVADIVQTMLMYGLFDRRKVDEARTYLSGRVDELRFPEQLAIEQSTSLHLSDGEAAYLDMPFNHRLVPCRDLRLIAGGRVEDLHTSPYWARQRGEAETFDANASAPSTSIVVRPRTTFAASGDAPVEMTDDLAGLIRATERGLYIANTWYLRMVAEMDGVITGMTRDGVFAIENGHLTGPVLNLRWHDNPFRMLGAVTGASRERLIFGRSRLAGSGRVRLSAAPALRIAGFHTSSVTRF